MFQFNIVFGIVISFLSNFLLKDLGDNSWRWMLGVEVVPAALLLGVLFLVPESPRWLVEMRRATEAEAILTKVAGPDHAAVELAGIRESLSAEQGTWSEVFSAALRRPLTVGILLAILQQVTGINVSVLPNGKDPSYKEMPGASQEWKTIRLPARFTGSNNVR